GEIADGGAGVGVGEVGDGRVAEGDRFGVLPVGGGRGHGGVVDGDGDVLAGDGAVDADDADGGRLVARVDVGVRGIDIIAGAVGDDGGGGVGCAVAPVDHGAEFRGAAERIGVE